MRTYRGCIALVLIGALLVPACEREPQGGNEDATVSGPRPQGGGEMTAPGQQPEAGDRAEGAPWRHMIVSKDGDDREIPP